MLANEIKDRLAGGNPWWTTKKPPKEADYPERIFFEKLANIALNWNLRRSVVLLGALRVGKTVMLKQP